MMLHISPSKEHPKQPSFNMDPYYLNFTHCPQASEGGYAEITAQGVSEDSCVLPSTALHTPGMNPMQSFRPSVGSGLIKIVSSSSSRPYHQARLRQTANRASAQHQGWCQLPFPTAPAPVPLSGTATLPAPAPVFDSASQSNIEAPNANQIMSSFMASFTLPRQAFLSDYDTPSPSYTPVDEADIEYAQYRYGNKRCFYQCRFDLSGSPCNKWIVGDRIRVLRHLRNYHRLQTGPATPALCRWDKCTHSRPMKQENLSRHVVMHLGVKWKCPHCRREFSRDDAVHRHIERMVPGMDVPDVEVVPGCEARAINESRSKRVRIA